MLCHPYKSRVSSSVQSMYCVYSELVYDVESKVVKYESDGQMLIGTYTKILYYSH